MQWSWILKCLPLSSFSYFIKMSQNLLRLHIISIYFLMYALHLYPTSLRRGSSNGTRLDALKKYGNQMSMKNIRWKICVSLSCVIIAVNQCTKLFKLLLQLLDAMTYRDICDKLCCRGQKILLFNFCLKHRVELVNIGGKYPYLSHQWCYMYYTAVKRKNTEKRIFLYMTSYMFSSS